MTNFESIKNMTVEELAYWLSDMFHGCVICNYDVENCIENGCRCGIKEWLESEVEE